VYCCWAHAAEPADPILSNETLCAGGERQQNLQIYTVQEGVWGCKLCILGHSRFIAQHQTIDGHPGQLPTWLFRSWLLPGQASGRTVTINCNEHRHFLSAETATTRQSFSFFSLSKVPLNVFGLFHGVCAQHVCIRWIQIQQYCCHEPQRATLFVSHSSYVIFHNCYLESVNSRQKRGHGGC
jgi:hypothetical protein